MSHVFPRNCHSRLPVAVAGDGCYLVDSGGKRYFDGSGGAAVSCLGHSNARVADAVKSQIDQLDFAHTSFFTSQPAEELADLLTRHAPGNLDRAIFVSGGSEAVESAIKLARQFHLERGEPQRCHLIARRQSYHGSTLGALSAGGNMWRRAQFEPLLLEVRHIAPCYEYAERSPVESSHDYGQRVANELEKEVLNLGPHTVAAFIAEPVVGATLGAVPPVDGYFRRIREICLKYGILLILDEVMCGMGRTGHLFACEAEGIAPDILCISKGLGAGYQPLGAMLCTDEVFRTIEDGSGSFQHGHTHLGHPVASAAGLAVLREILERSLVNQVCERGAFLEAVLRDRFSQHPHIGDIRGRGLFWGLEFVEERESKTPFDPAWRLASRLKEAAFAEGLLCYPMQGTRDGRMGDHVLLAPPYVADETELEGAVAMLERAVARALKDVTPAN